MNTIAVCIGSLKIYWSGVIIALAALVFLLLALAANRRRCANTAAVFVMFTLTVVFSILISRFLNWYCHTEQYVSFLSAFTDYSNGGYCIISVPIGILLSVWIVSRFGLAEDTAAFADDAFFGLPAAAALIRLSALFDNTCRSKIVITAAAFQRLPFAVPVTTAGGATEYRFATFFVEFLLMLLAQALLFAFRRSNRRRRSISEEHNTAGCGAFMSLLLFDAVELIMDSTRYDSSFVHFNGFVSLVQMFCAITMLGILVIISVPTVSSKGVSTRVIATWAGFLAGVVTVGISEYLVQRHGNWHVYCYAAMSVGVIAMTVSVYCAYLTATKKAKKSGIKKQVTAKVNA